MQRIYLDHSATTPVDKKVLEEMLPYFNEKFGNVSSIHSFGQEALAGIDWAREKLANFLNADTAEIIFTSGATEADNLALFGVINALQAQGIKKPHIVTTSIEHDAILDACAFLKIKGVEVSYVDPQKNGVVKVSDVINQIKDNTVLVSVMYVNNEVGSIQPIRKIGKEIKKINERRFKEWRNANPKERSENKPQEIYFHTDATQALNFMNCDTKWNYIDLLSLSGHKIYGPKGVGALYVRQGVKIHSVQKGGHHERNLRSGTLNVAGIVGLGKAIELLGQRREKGSPTKKQEKNNQKIAGLRDYFVDEVKKNIPKVIVNTDIKNSSPSHANIIFLGVEGESILMSLDLEGIAVSTGSACASASLEASHVLLSMGVSKDVAHSSVRFTFGKHNTKKEVDKVLKILPKIIERLRKISTEFN